MSDDDGDHLDRRDTGQKPIGWVVHMDYICQQCGKLWEGDSTNWHSIVMRYDKRHNLPPRLWCVECMGDIIAEAWMEDDEEMR